MSDTLACLASLTHVDYAGLRVVLVNNGSFDFDRNAAAAVFPGLHIIDSPENRGFAGGNNLGIDRALGQGAAAILLLNNDTIVRPQLIRALLPPLADASVGIVGPTVVYHDVPERVWFRGGVYRRWLGYTFHPGMDHPLRPPRDPPAHRSVDFITGCALLARRDVFERAGRLWDALFLYFEDAEFCLRAGQAGFRSVLVDLPLVEHRVSASAGLRGTNRLTPDRAYYFGRNPLLMAQRLAVPGGRFGWARGGRLGFLGIIVPIYIVRLVWARDISALRGYLSGVLDGLKGRTGRRASSA